MGIWEAPAPAPPHPSRNYPQRMIPDVSLRLISMYVLYKHRSSLTGLFKQSVYIPE